MTMTRNKNEKSGLSVASHLLFAGKLSTQTSDTITALWRDILLMMMLMMLVMMMRMACRHIPTMTKSHNGGKMSIMKKVGMCQCQIPTTHDKLQLEQLAMVSCSTRPRC